MAHTRNHTSDNIYYERGWEMKPLFIPLNAKYYDAFLDGSKFTEYRLYGKRWNLKTVYHGRPVLLSRGYGKNNRAIGVIGGFYIETLESLNPEIQSSLRVIYRLGIGRNTQIICIQINNIQPIKDTQ